MTNTKTVPLRDAGYRERVYAKALLASNGEAFDLWPGALDAWLYDASRDLLSRPDGRMHKVAWEGTRSVEVLREHELDDADCLDAPRSLPSQEGLAAALREKLEPLRGQANDEEARARALGIIGTFLEELRAGARARHHRHLPRGAPRGRPGGPERRRGPGRARALPRHAPLVPADARRAGGRRGRDPAEPGRARVSR